jgi:hypothetical protein
VSLLLLFNSDCKTQYFFPIINCWHQRRHGYFLRANQLELALIVCYACRALPSMRMKWYAAVSSTVQFLIPSLKHLTCHFNMGYIGMRSLQKEYPKLLRRREPLHYPPSLVSLYACISVSAVMILNSQNNLLCICVFDNKFGLNGRANEKPCRRTQEPSNG